MREGGGGGGGGGGDSPFERMDHTQLIQGFSDQTKAADAHFPVSVVKLILFLSISVCWFWFWLSQTRKRSTVPRDGVASLKRWLS